MSVAAAPGKPVVIAQFSDLHVVAGARDGFGVDTVSGLERCIRHLRALDSPPDLLVASGDLVDQGESVEYARLRDMLAAVEVPLCLMPGNHDRRAPLRQAFAGHDYLGSSGRMYYHRDVRGLRVIALDSVIEGRDGGDLDGAQLQWLDGVLGEQPAMPTLIFMHHPPAATGFSRMDRIAVAPGSARQLGELVARHHQVRALLCGHVHRGVQRLWQGALLSVCPSTAFQARLRLGAGRFEPDLQERPAYQLHHWDGDALVTHTVTV
ncbi:MAG: phosphodiesterase [Burkholderiales bacterium]|nr:phosphodiesterase [Burkholderiales bacterium]